MRNKRFVKKYSLHSAKNRKIDEGVKNANEGKEIITYSVICEMMQDNKCDLVDRMLRIRLAKMNKEKNKDLTKYEFQEDFEIHLGRKIFSILSRGDFLKYIKEDEINKLGNVYKDVVFGAINSNINAIKYVNPKFLTRDDSCDIINFIVDNGKKNIFQVINLLKDNVELREIAVDISTEQRLKQNKFNPKNNDNNLSPPVQKINDNSSIDQEDRTKSLVDQVKQSVISKVKHIELGNYNKQNADKNDKLIDSGNIHDKGSLNKIFVKKNYAFSENSHAEDENLSQNNEAQYSGTVNVENSINDAGASNEMAKNISNNLVQSINGNFVKNHVNPNSLQHNTKISNALHNAKSKEKDVKDMVGKICSINFGNSTVTGTLSNEKLDLTIEKKDYIKIGKDEKKITDSADELNYKNLISNKNEPHEERNEVNDGSINNENIHDGVNGSESEISISGGSSDVVYCCCFHWHS